MLGLLKAVSLAGGVVGFVAVASGGIVSILPQITKMYENMTSQKEEEVLIEEEPQNKPEPLPEQITPTLETEDIIPPPPPTIKAPDLPPPTSTANNDLTAQNALKDKKEQEQKQQQTQKFNALTEKVNNLIAAMNQKKTSLTSVKQTLDQHTSLLTQIQQEKTEKTESLKQATQAKALVEADLTKSKDAEKALKDKLIELGLEESEITTLLNSQEITSEDLKK